MIECTFEDGNKAQLRHITVDCVVVDDGKILITRRAKSIDAGDLLSLPGGFLDRDETTQRGAAREVFEETGYKVEITELLTIRDDPDRKGTNRQNVTIAYIAKPLEKIGEPDPHEVSEMSWVSLDQIPGESEFAFDHYDIIQEYLQKHHG